MENSFHFDMGRFLYLPGRKLGGLFVVSTAQRGVLRETLHLCSGHNARLKHLTLSAKDELKGN